jgi:hypothetical protein
LAHCKQVLAISRIALGWYCRRRNHAIGEKVLSRRRTYTKKAMAGKSSRDIGEGGEDLTRYALQRAGFVRIERVHTPFKIIRNSTGQIVDAVPQEKVSGDFRAMVRGTGKSVLVETKTTSKASIPWSALKPHQIEALDGHRQDGGLSLLSVVLCDVAYLLHWPVAGFGPGESLSATMSGIVVTKKQAIAIATVEKIP